MYELTDEEINTVLNAEIFIPFGEKYNRVAKAAQAKLQSYLVEKVEGMESEIKFVWRNNQEYKDGVKEGVEAFRQAVLFVIKEGNQ